MSWFVLELHLDMKGGLKEPSEIFGFYFWTSEGNKIYLSMKMFKSSTSISIWLFKEVSRPLEICYLNEMRSRRSDLHTDELILF